MELEHQGKVETGFRDFGVISIELERVLKSWKWTKPGRAHEREEEK